MPQSSPLHQGIWCAVPVFNNRATVRDVVTSCRATLRNVVVIDDGSTDVDLASLLAGWMSFFTTRKNLGKERRS
jgi:hypothetical protein